MRDIIRFTVISHYFKCPFGVKKYKIAPFLDTAKSYTLTAKELWKAHLVSFIFHLQAKMNSWKLSMWTPVKAVLQDFPMVALPGASWNFDYSFSVVSLQRESENQDKS